VIGAYPNENDCCRGANCANFPVFSPVSREFEGETGSPWTAPSASQSCLPKPFLSFKKKVRQFRGLGAHLKVSATHNSRSSDKTPAVFAASLRSRIFNIRNLLAETRFAECRDRFAMSACR